ncbi:Oidioi.mRNA.OKI2018_I69.PAR.g10240.t2.cds [Oikopleura dioica]|uniref:Oidioi.mRNA.OKI2018_I69.PAR.g10240.t2.cds n=1 Tax=Oikopleura dioica TaxID=34765 RepID=A0ABN7RU22_OIKDI|nr:Oidioi.mRNA.OKI2018_I69.PAR.g10240.t2.cds [Oikopleura dioica]
MRIKLPDDCQTTCLRQGFMLDAKIVWDNFLFYPKLIRNGKGVDKGYRAFIKLIESDYTPKYKVQSAQPAPKINLKQAADPVVLSLEELERGKKKKKIKTTTAPPTTTTFFDEFSSVAQNYDDYYFYPQDWKIKETTTTERYVPETTPWPTTPALVYTTEETAQQVKPQKFSFPAGLQIPAHLSNLKAGLFAAPKPNFGDLGDASDEYEYYYEYYYDENDSYYDDLGMRKPTKKKRRKRRKKNQKKKKNQKNYGNYQNSYSAPAFECWECLSANSFDDCRNRGRMVQCDGGSIGCDITVRSRRMNRYRDWYIEKVQMGCKQMQSCQTEHKFNFGYHPQCFPEDSTWPALLQWNHSTCRQCCGTSKCNFDWFQNEPDTTQEWNSTDAHTVASYSNYPANNGAYNGGYYNG